MLQMSFAGLMPSSSDSALSKPLHHLVAEQSPQNPDPLANGWPAHLNPTAFVEALTREAKTRMDQLAAGITRYQMHSFKRTRIPAPAIWTNGSAALRDYGGPADGPAVVLVPSLINRAYILDLSDDCSLAASTASAGVRTFLLDWGAPNNAEQNFQLEDYVQGVLIPALEHVNAITNTAPRLAGYCMGGTLTTAAAVLRPDLISGLALLAVPWDFHVESAASRAFISTFRPMIENMLDTLGYAPVDFLQAVFASLDPMLVSRKFRAFATQDPHTDAARRFVELEDWLNDGVNLAAPAARECLFGWYGENLTHKKAWRMDGLVIDPAQITTPTLAIIPSHDRIVPPESATALARQIPGCQTITVDLGHIGMIAGRSAPRLTYAPLAAWLKSLKKEAA